MSSAGQRDGQIPRRTGESTAVPAREFRSPLTRMLLRSDGLTTPLLEALAGGPVRVGRGDCGEIRAGRAEASAAPLAAADAAPLLVRRSVMVTGSGHSVSANRVIARLGLAPCLDACLRDPTAPLGPALAATGSGPLRRTLLSTGTSAWTAGRTPGVGCWRTYLMRLGDIPLAVVTEHFDPALVPAHTASHRGRCAMGAS
ncbi:hypothetical protein [Streptomyces sp. YIM 98790]|uniref:hypothetical protein n=1 Tax=Streptomyces sp. YIM 98790 TaxID=2689077 RepID=UPI00140B294F|nr:hypothetical protein [Streptomyces sp. YIM 98790]